MERFVIDETTNTLVKCNHHMTPERLDYLIVPHQYKGKQIDRIGPHCFDGLAIPCLCIEDGVEYLEDRACENAHIANVKLPRGLKIGERCFAESDLIEILLPRDLHTIKSETFKNCKFLETISAQFGVNTISYSAFDGCENLKEAYFRIVKSVKDYAFNGCVSLKTLDLGCRIDQLGMCLFNDCSSLENLKLMGFFDKFHFRTFEGANGLSALELQTSADSLYFPPDGFKDTCLKEISLIGDFEPIVEKRSCFPGDILIRGYDHQKPQQTLAYYFQFEMIA